MSGTLAHNRWHNISGYLDFIKGHPYTTDRLSFRQYLDVIALMMHRKFSISCLRFDGTIGQEDRVVVQENFGQNEARPFLITAGAGSLGLNMTSGSRVILVEEWRNANVQAQAISRCCTQQVLVYKLRVENSAIDKLISRARDQKIGTNECLLAPLIHRHDEAPKVVQI